MKNFLSTTPDSIIYTASKDETVTLNYWNRHEDIHTDAGCISGLNTYTNSDVYDKDTTLSTASPTVSADRGHEIKLKAGESIYAWCSKENLIEYTVE